MLREHAPDTVCCLSFLLQDDSSNILPDMFFFSSFVRTIVCPWALNFSLLGTLHGPHIQSLPNGLALILLSLMSALALHGAGLEKAMHDKSHGERLGLSLRPASAIVTTLDHFYSHQPSTSTDRRSVFPPIL